MQARRDAWAIVLAAGDGSRLRALTRDVSGRAVPKQFCSLNGPRTLLEDAIARAGAVVPNDRIVVVVAEQHRCWWGPQLARIPACNVVVQPENRGTAPGLVLPLLSILRRDPAAHVVVLPSDHYVEREDSLADALVRALDTTHQRPRRVLLLGIAPDAPEPEYGWIVAGRGRSNTRRVERFVEKPAPDAARRLYRSGALWNAFLIVARGRTLRDLVAHRLGLLVRALLEVVLLPAPEQTAALRALYERLESADFSRAVLQGSERRLAVQAVPPCGWTDLGTPTRVAQCVSGTRRGRDAPHGAARFLDLQEALRTAAGTA